MSDAVLSEVAVCEEKYVVLRSIWYVIFHVLFLFRLKNELGFDKDPKIICFYFKCFKKHLSKNNCCGHVLV